MNYAVTFYQTLEESPLLLRLEKHKKWLKNLNLKELHLL